MLVAVGVRRVPTSTSSTSASPWRATVGFARPHEPIPGSAEAITRAGALWQTFAVSFTIEATDHQGRLIASIQLTRDLEIRLPAITDTRYPILRFLDPYGDTTLNTLQIAQLLIELDQLRADVSEPAALQCIDALATIARSVQTQPHGELTFIGD